MAFGRIPTPVDDEVRSVLDFAKSASDLATQLGGYLSGAVSKRGVAVDHTSNHFGECHGAPTGLAGDVAEAVHQRHVGVIENVGRDFDGFLAEQRDLGPKWIPAFVRPTGELPKLASMKLDKTRLRAEAWETPGTYWRPARGEALRPLTDDDRAALAPLLDRRAR